MSGGADEVMMPVPTPEALRLAELHATRALTDAVSALTRRIEQMDKKVDDVRERVIRLEAQPHDREIEKLKSDLGSAFRRINELESDRDKRTGALGLVGWVQKLWPIGVALFAGWLGTRTGGV